jgi:hypothetical protein
MDEVMTAVEHPRAVWFAQSMSLLGGRPARM